MRQTYVQTSLTAAWLLCLLLPAAALIVVPPPEAFHHAAPMLLDAVSSISLSSSSSSLSPQSLLGDVAQQANPLTALVAVGKAAGTSYMSTLAQHPLATKMATGGVLAVGGDAVAQAAQQQQQQQQQQASDDGSGKKYDRRRAVSFVAFDVVYRAFQHASFPAIVAKCHGQYLGPLAVNLQSALHLSIPTHYIPAIEQTLANQLIIILFLYYPVFFALTGFVQGISLEASAERFKQSIVPLMQRNLAFWIPFQFIQFAYVEENLQVPFVCAVGLMWTTILSFSAGSATKYETGKVPGALLQSTASVGVAEDDEQQLRIPTQKGLEPITQTTSN